ncbi:MAG: hypothetical protein ACPIOQ_62185, partial [Promethearchaeia archaeon]
MAITVVVNFNSLMKKLWHANFMRPPGGWANVPTRATTGDVVRVKDGTRMLHATVTVISRLIWFDLQG